MPPGLSLAGPQPLGTGAGELQLGPAGCSRSVVYSRQQSRSIGYGSGWTQGERRGGVATQGAFSSCFGRGPWFGTVRGWHKARLYTIHVAQARARSSQVLPRTPSLRAQCAGLASSAGRWPAAVAPVGCQRHNLRINRKKGTWGDGRGFRRTSVVSVLGLPAGDPVLLGGHSAPWRRVTLFLRDANRVVLRHDLVVAGPPKEVTPGGPGRGLPSVVVGQPLCL